MELFAIFALVAGALAMTTGTPPEPLVKAPVVSDRVVLTPSPNGTVGRVIVTSAAGKEELSTAYAGLSVRDAGKMTLSSESAESVNAQFGALLGARPQPASGYVLYFKTGTVELTPESVGTLELIRNDVRNRPAPEIRVVGHADTQGPPIDSPALSLKRARSFVDLLNASGIRAHSVEVVGRGSSDPLVVTGPNVNEPRNRRVEVSVR